MAKTTPTGGAGGDKGASVFNGDLEFTPEEDAILDEIWDQIIAEEGETGDEDEAAE